jgi:hypothetical protein
VHKTLLNKAMQIRPSKSKVILNSEYSQESSV